MGDAVNYSALRRGLKKRSDNHRARLRKYGLTQDQYDAMLSAQEGKCAVCKKAEPTAIDHDHATGAVRGLLCNRCNGWLAPIEEPGFVDAALRYLQHEEESVTCAA